MTIYDITGRHFRITEALKAHVTGRLDALESLGEPVVDAKVTLSYAVDGDSAAPVAASAQLNLPGHTLRAEEHGQDAYLAVDRVVTKLARQLKSLKSRRVAQRHRPEPTP